MSSLKQFSFDFSNRVLVGDPWPVSEVGGLICRATIALLSFFGTVLFKKKKSGKKNPTTPPQTKPEVCNLGKLLMNYQNDTAILYLPAVET